MQLINIIIIVITEQSINTVLLYYVATYVASYHGKITDFLTAGS